MAIEHNIFDLLKTVGAKIDKKDMKKLEGLAKQYRDYMAIRGLFAVSHG